MKNIESASKDKFPINLLGKIERGGVHNLSIYDELNIDDGEWSKLGRALQANAALKDRSEELTILDLHNSNFGNEGMVEVAKFLQQTMGVEQINIANSQITAEVMTELVKGIANQSNLAHLSLAGNTLDDESVIQLLAALQDKPLVQLDLSDVNITAASARAIADFLANNTTIEMLFLQENNLTDVMSTMQEGLENCQSLRQLDMAHCALNERDLLSLAQAVRKQNLLTQLCVNGNSLEHCADKFFGLFADQSSDDALALEALLIADTSLKSIGGLCQFLGYSSYLKTLSLNGNALQTKQFSQLVKAVSDTKLQRLFLRHIDLNHTTRTALKELIKSASSLRHLDISDNPLSTQTHTSICNAMEGNQNLVVLEVAKTNVTDNQAKAYATVLKNNSELKSLDLSENTITRSGLRRLAMAARENYRIEAVNLDQNPWQEEYLALKDDPKIIVENIVERLIKTLDAEDEKALEWIKEIKFFKAIDDFDRWKELIPDPTSAQEDMLDQLELALLVRELFRNCHDNRDINQVIDHAKPEQGVMQLMSIMAQRQSGNCAEPHFMALAAKIERVKETYKLQEVMESLKAEDMIPPEFKQKLLEQQLQAFVFSQAESGDEEDSDQDYEADEEGSSLVSDDEENDKLSATQSYTPGFNLSKDASGTPTVTLDVTDEQRAVFEAAMKDFQKAKEKKENNNILSQLKKRQKKR